MKGDSTCHIFTGKGRDRYDDMVWDSSKPPQDESGNFFVYVLGDKYYIFSKIVKTTVQIPEKFAMKMGGGN